jgi:hypothetical protein
LPALRGRAVHARYGPNESGFPGGATSNRPAQEPVRIELVDEAEPRGASRDLADQGQLAGRGHGTDVPDDVAFAVAVVRAQLSGLARVEDHQVVEAGGRLAGGRGVLGVVGADDDAVLEAGGEVKPPLGSPGFAPPSARQSPNRKRSGSSAFGTAAFATEPAAARVAHAARTTQA